MTKKNFQIFTACLMIMTLVGAYMNAFQIKECFYIWIVANIGWTIVDIEKEIWFGAIVHIVFGMACIVALFSWE